MLVLDKLGYTIRMIDSFYKKPFPVLDMDEQFYLREQQLDDTDAFFEYYTKPEVSQYILASTPQNKFEAEGEIYYCRNLFRMQRGIYWTIARRDNDQMVGAIGLYINNYHHRAELSYDLSPNYWRQGIMSRAIEVVKKFALTAMDISRLEAITMLENTASQNLLTKAGFLHEGRLHAYKYYNGKAYDIEMFAVVR